MRVIPAASGCTNPGADGAVPASGGLDPGQLAGAYGVSGLWNAGYEGQRQSVAVLEVQQSLGPPPTGFSDFSACYGPWLTPVEHVLPAGSPPPPSVDEGLFDPEVAAAAAPRARVYMFESAETSESVGAEVPSKLPLLLKAALNPRNTGGRLVDAVSTSEISCEAAWPASDVKAMQLQLRRAASLGVAVFAAAGDWGSAATYTPMGQTSCFAQPVTSPPQSFPGTRLGAWYPGSSPLVTSVGGTELVINGVVPPPAGPREGGFPAGGTITDEIVWDQYENFFGGYMASGGGPSSLFTVADAPWERDVPLSGAGIPSLSAPEETPVISALAGSPQYLSGGVGTSGASPYMAGATAVLDQYLTAHHRRPIGMLNPTLFHIAANPTDYAAVFNDVVHGTNQLVTAHAPLLPCCSAERGYDEASGLGSLNFAALGAAVLARPKLVVPWTKLKLTAAPASSIGIPETIEASTNNVIRGTPYRINIYVKGKLLGSCHTSVCAFSYTPPTLAPQTIRFSADVGPRHTKPFSKNAIVSKKGKALIHYTRPCTPPKCT